MQEEYQKLILLYLSGEASAEQKQRLFQWVDANPDHAALYQTYKKIWDHASFREEQAPERVFAKVLSRIDTDRPKPVATHPKKYAWMVRAAAVIFVVGFTWLFYQWLESSADQTNTLPLVEVTTKKGETTKVTLPDSSVVWLNADGKLTYPEVFDSLQRMVTLTGEAFFKVKKNPDSPFIIKLPESQVKVLGTSFNVRAYAEEDWIATTVVSGRVAFQTHPEEKDKTETLISPDHKVLFSRTTGSLQRDPVAASQEIAWIRGGLVFQNSPLKDILAELSRHYGISYHFSSEAVKNCKLTGTFYDKSLEEVLQALAMTEIFDFTITEEAVLIRGEGCYQQ